RCPRTTARTTSKDQSGAAAALSESPPRGSATCACGLPVDDDVPLDTEPVDAHLDYVAGLEIARRLGAVAHARRRTRGDEIAGLERHEAAHVGHELAHRKDHVARVAVLPTLAVHGGPDPQSLGIRNLVGRHEPRSHRPEGIGALPLRRGATVLHLEGALR